MTDVSSSEESSDEEEDIVTIALTNEEPSLHHPPMCLMAKGISKVCESEDDSDEELDPNEFTNLINEYTSVIKREKGKVKILKSTCHTCARPKACLGSKNSKLNSHVCR